MDIETIKRVKGDFNHSKTMKMNSQKSQDQQVTNQSYQQSEEQTEKTHSLIVMYNNIIDLNLKEIIALYDQIDKKIFYHFLEYSVIYSEFNQFNDVSQFENQRIVLNCYKNSFIVAGYLLQTQQLVVLKEIEVGSQETLIQHLDEYKIHYKINQLFPLQSLELIIPVKVEKGQNFYQLSACMERAQFNLYQYSRNHQIGDEEAMNIFVQIMDQIINLHSVNIAHRDVKPQNIFYVKEKGWLLSDFGESLEYEEVDGLYNIRGTKYFLKPALQSYIHKNGKYDQNLMTNDTYALVVSMIMIKNQQYINDMKNQIENLRDDLLKQFIKLQNLAQLIQFRETIQFNLNKDLINLTKSCYKELNGEEQNFNFRCNIFSLVQHIVIQNIDNLDPIWLQNLLQIVKKNYKFIIQKFNNVLPTMLMNSCLFQNVGIKFELDRNSFKRIQNQRQQQQELYFKLLFIYGYTEKLINLANEYLNKQYSQSVHILLIDSYFRANMPQEAEQQLKQFNEGMVFDQLNTSSQNKYLQYLYHLNGDQLKHNVQFDFNIKQELKQRGLQKQKDFMTEFLKEQQLLQNDPYLNREKIVYSIIQRVDLVCKEFSLLNSQIFYREIFPYIKNQPLFVFLSLLQKIHQQHYGQLDINRKFALQLQIAESFIMLNSKKEFMENLKLIKKYFFFSESWEQTICFKIIYQTILFFEYIFQEKNCKFNFNLHMRKFVNELNKTKQIKFKCYFQYINRSLLNLIRNIKKYQIYHKNHQLVYIIQFIINLAFKHNFHITEYDRYQLFHIQAQWALIYLKNDNRSQLLVQSQKKFLNEKASQIVRQKKMDRLNYQIKPSIRKILGIRVLKSQQMNKIITKEFIFNRFFEV